MSIKDYQKHLENNSEKIPISGCWIWSKAHGKSGYSTTTYKGKRITLHRLSYQTYKGAIDDNLHVCHTCDNPSCINPDHLFLGTAKDNMRDMSKKGKQHLTKLTQEAVKEIRNTTNTWGSGVLLANKFKVRPTTICAIRKERTWV